ncbi:hypothetical protein AB0395_45805 [Streptosporangium sp. NPDC051023]|uniref:hypothetical protein n=1 Tax=Streptosporangium sp. NPDC051023 TaxID=3155410 RepID=UPI00344C6276
MLYTPLINTPPGRALKELTSPSRRRAWPPETGIAVFKVAFARWISEPNQAELPEILPALTEQLADVVAGDAVRCQGPPDTRPTR